MKPISLGVRGKFLLITVLIVVAVNLAVGVYLQWQLRAAQTQGVEDELSRYAGTARDFFAYGLEQGTLTLTPETIDPITDQLSESIHARVTFIGADGRVLGDSSLTQAELEVVDDHRDRPEVRSASFDSCGLARRRSDTLGTDMLYCAIALEVPGPVDASTVAYVRVATPLEVLNDSFTRVRLILVFGGLLSLALAVGVGFVASRGMYSKIRELVVATQAMAEGDSQQRLPVVGGDEFGGIAGSLNRVSEELARTVKQLARERDLFEAVINSMADAVIATDRKRRIIAINPSGRALLSIKGEVHGRLLLEVVRIPQLSEGLDHALRGESLSIDVDLDLSGQRRHLLMHATPQGKSGGAVLVMHDITEIRRLETVRRDFVANVSHELRTPVSVIQANTETLLLGALDDPEAAKRFLDAVRRNAERLGQLISDLLDISRIEAGKYEIEMCSLNLDTVTQAVARSVGESCRRREVRFEFDIPPKLRVYGDDSALQQVLVNLVENAVKYGPEGGLVRLVAFEQGAAVRLEVRDEGPGIAPDHRGRVFERFYRVDPGRSRHMGGTGLGLAIVKNLAEAMGAQVGVEPREPTGSCFWVLMGRVSADAQEAAPS